MSGLNFDRQSKSFDSFRHVNVIEFESATTFNGLISMQWWSDQCHSSSTIHAHRGVRSRCLGGSVDHLSTGIRSCWTQWAQLPSVKNILAGRIHVNQRESNWKMNCFEWRRQQLPRVPSSRIQLEDRLLRFRRGKVVLSRINGHMWLFLPSFWPLSTWIAILVSGGWRKKTQLTEKEASETLRHTIDHAARWIRSLNVNKCWSLNHPLKARLPVRSLFSSHVVWQCIELQKFFLHHTWVIHVAGRLKETSLHSWDTYCLCLPLYTEGHLASSRSLIRSFIRYLFAIVRYILKLFLHSVQSFHSSLQLGWRKKMKHCVDTKQRANRASASDKILCTTRWRWNLSSVPHEVIAQVQYW